jgi:prepilin-type N-terminal cleavage/methylation domain-containing protein
MKPIRSLLVAIVAAASVGSAVAIYRMYAGDESQIGGAGWIDQTQFQRDLRLPPVMGKSYARNLTTHADLEVDVVSFDELDPTTLTYHRVKFAQPRLNGTSSSDSAALKQFLGANPELASSAAKAAHAETLLTVVLAGIGAIGSGLIAWLAMRSPRLQPVRTVAEAPASSQSESSRVSHDPLCEVDETPAVSNEPKAAHATEPAPAKPLSQEEVVTPVEGSETSKEYQGEYYPVARNQKGYSLIELLTAIAVLALLMTVLLPALTAARRQAQTVQCASQLKQIGEALHAYANNNSGWLPAFSGWHTWPAGQPDDSPGPAWTAELRPYLADPDAPIYVCPSLPSPVRFRTYFLAGRWSGVNHQQAMKLSDITLSGRFVLSGDKTQLALYPRPFGTNQHTSDDADPDDSGDGDPVLAWPWQHGGFYMHRRGNNVLFDDDHVATMSGFDATSMTFNPHRVEDWADVTPG